MFEHTLSLWMWGQAAARCVLWLAEWASESMSLHTLFQGDPPWLPWRPEAICCITGSGIFYWWLALGVLEPVFCWSKQQTWSENSSKNLQNKMKVLFFLTLIWKCFAWSLWLISLFINIVIIIHLLVAGPTNLNKCFCLWCLCTEFPRGHLSVKKKQWWWVIKWVN